MEKLLARLGSIEEKILDLYEKDSKKLSDHIELWTLIRREHALWHVLRQEGYSRVGGRVVPSLAASESQAKFAIEMTLTLESLQKSQYGQEEWTLAETSRERFLSEPSRTFKKMGSHLTIMFDDDPNNLTEVVVWKWVYHLTDNNSWHKARGGHDDIGVYYEDVQGNKVYFISFAEEATNFSETGTYEVTLGSALERVHDEPDSLTGRSSPQPNTRIRSRSSPRKKVPRHSSSSTSGQGFQKDPHPETGEITPRQRGGRPQQQGKHNTPTRRRRVLRGSRTSTPVHPGARRSPRKSPESTPGRHRAGSGSLQKKGEASHKGYHLVCLRGPANSLRCTRYKLRKKYQSLIHYMGTSFTWTETSGASKCGSARCLIAFKTLEDREHFMKVVVKPKNIGMCRGYLDQL